IHSGAVSRGNESAAPELREPRLPAVPVRTDSAYRVSRSNRLTILNLSGSQSEPAQTSPSLDGPTAWPARAVDSLAAGYSIVAMAVWRGASRLLPRAIGDHVDRNAARVQGFVKAIHGARADQASPAALVERF